MMELRDDDYFQVTDKSTQYEGGDDKLETAIHSHEDKTGDLVTY